MQLTEQGILSTVRCPESHVTEKDGGMSKKEEGEREVLSTKALGTYAFGKSEKDGLN